MGNKDNKQWIWRAIDAKTREIADAGTQCCGTQCPRQSHAQGKRTKQLAFILGIGVKRERNNYGIPYLEFIDNAPFVTLIFGLLMIKFFLQIDINQLVKKPV